MKRGLALILCLLICFCSIGLTGCGTEIGGETGNNHGVKTDNKTGNGYSGNSVELDPYDMELLYTICLEDLMDRQDLRNVIADFSLELFRESYTENDNNVISPLSATIALGILAMGTDGDSRTEIESVFAKHYNSEKNDGLLDAVLAYLCQYQEILMQRGTNINVSPIKLNNSLWIRNEENRLNVEKNYIYEIYEYFRCRAFSSPFDESTVNDINYWCEESTDGQIKEMLDEIPYDAVLYILNALSFDGQWQRVYEEDDIKEFATFTTEKGEIQNCTMMYSSEGRYLQDENTKGFIKNYKDGFSFVALLPSESIKIKDYVDSLNGEKWRNLFEISEFGEVFCGLPKFSAEKEIGLVPMLKTMGIKDIFIPNKANLSKIGESSFGNLYASDVRQKVVIDVNDKGTKAAAVTMIQVKDTAIAMPVEPKEVILDRPFVYAIIDNETNTPLFLGTVESM